MSNGDRAPAIAFTALDPTRYQHAAGDVIGFTGYSEAPHLHYQNTRVTDGARLLPPQTGLASTTAGGCCGDGTVCHPSGG